MEIALHGHRPVDLVIERDDTEQVVTVVPKFDKASGLYQLGVEPSYGDFEVDVQAESIAAAAGLQDGDTLVSINGAAATGEAIVDALATGAPVAFEARRGDEVLTGTVENPKAEDPAPAVVGITTLARKVLGLRRADWLTDLDLRRDDTLLAIDGPPVPRRRARALHRRPRGPPRGTWRATAKRSC